MCKGCYNKTLPILHSTPLMTTRATQGIFDFLRGERTISLANETEKEEEDLKNETWTLYTFNTESKECPLDCLIVAVKRKEKL